MKRKQGIESSRKLGGGRLVAALIGALCALFVSATPALAAEPSITNERTKATYTDIAEATAAAESGDTLMLGEGNYTLYGVSSTGHTKGKDLTFEGAGADKTSWRIGREVPDPDYGGERNGDYSFDGAGTVTFKNMRLRSAEKAVNYQGFIRIDNTVVDNCVIDGKTFYWGYKTATFTKTTFNAPSGDYAIWTYSSPTMTFNDCTFNASGKVINVYTDYGAGSHDITVNVNNCTFNSNDSKGKQALNINDSNMGSFKYIIKFTGANTATAGRDTKTCSQLFGFGGNSTYNSGSSDVYFDDELVWTQGAMKTHSYTDGQHEDNFVDLNDYVWTQEGEDWYCTGHAKCGYCGWPIEEKVKAEVVVDPATCLEAGKTSYVAKFSHKCFTQQTKSGDAIDSLGHDWNEPTYTWNQEGDDWYCTAKRVCKRDASHVEEETVKATYEVTTPATVLKEGVGTYTATFENTAFETQTKTEPIAKLQILPGKPSGGNNTALPGKPGGGNNTALPQTGDPTGMAASVVIAIAGAAAVVGSVIARRHSKM